jgi:AbiV family abortive infection protein
MNVDASGMPVPSEVIEEAYFRIIKNAQRLTSDARLLLEHKRFASSVALSVLAVEEVGKIFAIDTAAEKAKVANHITKRQAVAQVFRDDLAAIDGLQVWLEELNHRGLAPPYDGSKVTPVPSPSDRSKSRFVEHVDQGRDLKNQALYVDIARDGSWKINSDPVNLTQTDAEEWISIVEAALVAVSPTLWAIFGE